jgi:Methyltransferase domain
MTSAYARSKLVGLAYAMAKCVIPAKLHGRRVAEFSSPVVEVSADVSGQQSSRRGAGGDLPRTFCRETSGADLPPPESLDRQIWHIRLDEEVLIDLVFVDAAHDYPHGLADSRTALRLVRPGGVILWHDFNPQFPGLVHAIIEATDELPLKRLGMHTTLGFLTYAGLSRLRVAISAGNDIIVMSNLSISVAMTTFNGARHLSEQWKIFSVCFYCSRR